MDIRNLLVYCNLAPNSKLATNPTPKGDKPTDAVSQREMDRYLSKISGPLIDRIDIHVAVPPVPFTQLSNERSGTDSATMRQSILQARKIQMKRNSSSLYQSSMNLSECFCTRLFILDIQNVFSAVKKIPNGYKTQQHTHRPRTQWVDSIPKRNAGEFVEHFDGRSVIEAFPRTIIQ
ncbi:ATP-binding protein [bacterium AH-315-I18]|nr:ATP-binding protein [bacterium AH-315-I18]